MPEATVSPSFDPTSSPSLTPTSMPLPPQAAPQNKLAMSRALGAAFLSHQVEQLEKSVAAPRIHNGNNSGNWRDRQRPHHQPPNDSKRGQLPIGGIRFTTTATHPHQQHQHQQRERSAPARKRGAEDAKKKGAKEADVIVVDASVLVNALGQVKKWCREGQEEIIIVPLEGMFSISPPLSSTPCHACLRALCRDAFGAGAAAALVMQHRPIAWCVLLSWQVNGDGHSPLPGGTRGFSQPASPPSACVVCD
jgi:hypothetical protein